MVKGNISFARLLVFVISLLLAKEATSFSPRPSRNDLSMRESTPLSSETSSSSSSSPSSISNLGAPICDYHQVDIPTSQEGPPRQAISDGERSSVTTRDQKISDSRFEISDSRLEISDSRFRGDINLFIQAR